MPCIPKADDLIYQKFDASPNHKKGKEEKRKVNKKISVTTVILTLLMWLSVSSVTFAQPPNPYELRICTPVNGPSTLDPANTYDTYSAELMFNVYETLIFFDGERFDLFLPSLATQVWVAPPDPAAPTYTNYTVYFKIRVGAPFHTWCRSDIIPVPIWDQYYLTPVDVEHSFERLMVYDYPGGMQWTIFEPLLDCHGANPNNKNFGMMINNAVQSNATHVWINIANKGLAISPSSVSFTPIPLFDEGTGRQSPAFWDEVANLPLGYPLRILFQSIAQSWSSIMSKSWLLDYVDSIAEAAGHPVGEWPRTFENWTSYWYPGMSPTPLPCVDMIPSVVADPGVACGTGPYILDWLQWAYGWSLVKYDNYWGGWPADNPHPPYPPVLPSCVRPAGWVERLTVLFNRPLQECIQCLIDGDCDFIYSLPSGPIPQLHENGNINGPTLEGIRVYYPICTLSPIGSFHFTFNVTPTPDNHFGKINDYGVLSEDGIPRDLFNDTHIRKAFAYCINFTMIIQDLLQNHAYQPVTFAPSGLPYVNPAQEHYYLDIAKAIQEFQMAWNGQLVNVGFTIILAYNSGNLIRQAVCQQMADLIESIGDVIAGGKFHAYPMGYSWSEYLSGLVDREIPTFLVDFQTSSADIHTFAFFYCHSNVTFPMQGYLNSTMDGLVEEGIRTPDSPLRQEIYYQLEELYYEEVPSVPLYVRTGLRRYERRWVNGWYYNPLYPGTYAYPMWKWEYLKGDVNHDGKVSMDDIIILVDAFGSYCGKRCTHVVHPRWNFHCDMDCSPMHYWCDRKINMGDIVNAIADFGKTSQPWQPPPTPPTP